MNFRILNAEFRIGAPKCFVGNVKFMLKIAFFHIFSPKTRFYITIDDTIE